MGVVKIKNRSCNIFFIFVRFIEGLFNKPFWLVAFTCLLKRFILKVLRFMRYFVFSVLICSSLSFLPGSLYAQEFISLKEAVAYAIEQNYAIRIAKGQQNINESNNTLGNAGFLPRLDLNAAQSFSVNDVNQEFLSGVSNELKGAQSDNFNFGAALVWTIFDGGGMFIARRRLEELERQGKYDVQIAIENTIVATVNAYYEIIQQKQRLKALEDALKVSEQRLQLAKDNYEVGKGGKAEFLNAQIDYNTDKAAIIRQEQAIYNAKINLQEAMGRAVFTEIEISDTLTILNEGLRLEAVQQAARQNNQQLKQAEIRRNVVYYQMQQQKALRYPEINLFANYNFVKQNSEAGFLLSNQSSGFTYGINASVNIFNGFNQRRLENNTRIELMNEEQRIELLKLQINAQIARAYRNYANSLLLVKLEQENLEFNRQSVDITLERYKQGVATPLELREVQRSIIATETRLTEALFNAKIAEIELQRLSGELLKAT